MTIRRISLIFNVFIFISVAACSTAPYTEDFTIQGTIEEKITKEKFLFDDQLLLIKESGKEGGNESVYEIPVDSFKGYEVGQKVEVTVFSNTDADVWDSDQMKFEITIIE